MVQDILHSHVRAEHTCAVVFGSLPTNAGAFGSADHFVIVFDRNTSALAPAVTRAFSAAARVDIVTMPVAGEHLKSRESFDYLVSQLATTSFARRRSTLVAAGGGALMDLAGFVAATYMRGISLALVPTTLLAMVDAAIGGKTGINTDEGKHVLGAFHYPDVVYVDTSLLATLPARNYRAAFGELIKVALIHGDDSYFRLLEQHAPGLLERSHEILTSVIRGAIRKKLELVEPDWREIQLDRLLNLGHEVAHALEASAHFDDSLITHGEAVAVGVMACSRIASQRGLFPVAAAERVATLVRTLVDIPRPLRSFDDLGSHLRVISRTRDGNVRVVLPVASIGNARVFHDVTTPEIEEGVAEAFALTC